jgi:hypothetical protein
VQRAAHASRCRRRKLGGFAVARRLLCRGAMRAILICTLLFAFGCGKSAQQVCDEAVSANCDIALRCPNKGFGDYGSKQACVDKVSQGFQCEPRPTCPDGGVWHQEKLEQCTAATKARTDCDATKLPVVCLDFCAP